MTICRSLDEEIALNFIDFQEQYKDNVFFIKDKLMFCKLALFCKKSSDINNDISKVQNMRLKKWLDATFANNITYEDKAKLIMNGITHLPKCKCDFKKMKVF